MHVHQLNFSFLSFFLIVLLHRFYPEPIDIHKSRIVGFCFAGAEKAHFGAFPAAHPGRELLLQHIGRLPQPFQGRGSRLIFFCRFFI
jgi:hypothetical protein